MDILQIILLALLQGLTEFLPISSSAHLILFPAFSGWQDQGLAFDVAVHVGTLFAVMWYFRAEIRQLFLAWVKSLVGRHSSDSHLAWGVIVGTIPVGLVGLVGHEFIATQLRTPSLIAVTTIVFALLLWFADARRTETRDEHTMTWKIIMFIGLAQALALIPGTSRSGITMTAGLLAGMTRAGAARFSFLLSIPVILLAGGLETKSLLESAEPVAWLDLVLGSLLSFAAAYACIHYFLKWLPQVGMLPFVIYRLLLGLLLFVIIW
ncbi:MAG: undecaprenyl-diphosphate phosphatase [Gammaproteobacteria bacterium]|nr:undecaprenyl-diphosphate phosphatase [Gammaproteobacteria bacterium]